MKEPIYVTRSSMPPLEEYVEMIKPLWDSHRITNMGHYHQELEKQLKGYLNISNISLMTNGHLALELAIQALNMSGEVITSPFTFISTTHAIARNGLKPVFCDVDSETYTIDVSKIEALITEKTCAILPVHVYGNACNVEEIQKIADKYKLKVIYDAAHTFGAKYKGKSMASYGDVSILSFHATKVFNTVEGGAVIHNSEAYAKELYSLKNFGIRNEELIDGIGANAKMDEFRAAMGLCNLKYIDRDILNRKDLAQRYKDQLSGINGIHLLKEQSNVESNYAYFPVVFDENHGYFRNEIYEVLKNHNIFARKYFYPLTNEADCYKRNYNVDETPIAKGISRRILTLPLYSGLEIADVDRICEIIKNTRRGCF